MKGREGGRRKGWGRGKEREERKKERKKEGREDRREDRRKDEKKERQKYACVCRCCAALQPLPVPSWALLPTLLPLPTSPHLVSLSLSLCPQTPSLALTPHPKHSTPLPLCRSFSHPSLHFGPLHQTLFTTGSEGCCVLVCLAFDRLTSEKKKKLGTWFSFISGPSDVKFSHG